MLVATHRNASKQFCVELKILSLLGSLCIQSKNKDVNLYFIKRIKKTSKLHNWIVWKQSSFPEELVQFGGSDCRRNRCCPGHFVTDCRSALAANWLRDNHFVPPFKTRATTNGNWSRNEQLKQKVFPFASQGQFYHDRVSPIFHPESYFLLLFNVKIRYAWKSYEDYLNSPQFPLQILGLNKPDKNEMFRLAQRAGNFDLISIIFYEN